MVTSMVRRATILHDVAVKSRSPDPKDDPILAAAVAGAIDIVISGDRRDMLALDEVEGIPIRSTRDALAILFREQDS